MRPQRNAAENVNQGAPTIMTIHASMRPQRNAAENARAQNPDEFVVRASMRPQRNAAENVTFIRASYAACAGFNEAAA